MILECFPMMTKATEAVPGRDVIVMKKGMENLAGEVMGAIFRSGLESLQ